LEDASQIWVPMVPRTRTESTRTASAPAPDVPGFHDRYRVIQPAARELLRRVQPGPGALTAGCAWCCST
jgi:hypothetical protein